MCKAVPGNGVRTAGMTSQLFTPCFHVCQPDTYGSPPQSMKPADKIAGVSFRLTGVAGLQFGHGCFPR